VLLCPIGFVSDHLEVLYDVDIELQQLARSLDLRLERADSLNQHPRFIAALAEQVDRAARSAGWT
jgi:ferrochelatase